MRATRRAAALPIMAVPMGLEERILAAAKEAPAERERGGPVPDQALARRHRRGALGHAPADGDGGRVPL